MYIHIARDRFDLRQNLRGGIFFCLRSDELREQTGVGHDWEV